MKDLNMFDLTIGFHVKLCPLGQFPKSRTLRSDKKESGNPILFFLNQVMVLHSGIQGPLQDLSAQTVILVMSILLSSFNLLNIILCHGRV